MDNKIMDKKINVALIGCGDVAIAHHIPAVLESDDFKLTALCDVNEDVVKALSDKYQTALYTDYREVLKNPLIHAVIIATPPWITPKIICDSLIADKYVLSEKPMALTLDEAEKIKSVQNMRENKSLLQIGFTYRHDPLVKQLRKWIIEEKLGHPLVFRLGFFDEIWDPDDNPEHYQRISETLNHGSPSIHDGAHAADYLNFLSGSEVAYVQSVGFKSRPEFKTSNYDLSFVYFKNGDMAKLEIGWFYPVFPRSEFEILGPLGYASYDYHGRNLKLQTKTGIEEISDSENWWQVSFKNQLAAFAESIKSNNFCVPGVEEGIFSLDLCKKIEHSIKNNGYSNYVT